MVITLDGIKPKELGFMVVRGTDAPILPKTRNSGNTKVMPGRHGQIRYGKTYLDALEWELPCKVLRQEDFYKLQMRARDIANFFTDDYGNPRQVKLIFDYEPDRYYMVQYEGFIPLQRLVTYGKFILPLVADDPHAHSIVESTKGIKWGDRIPWMSQIPIGIGRTSYTISSPQTLSINNYGSLVVRPVIEISGSATSLTLTIKGESFSIGTFTNSTILIDAERYAAIKNGQNFLFQLQGNLEKLELMPGANAIQIGGSNLNINIAFKYRAKYM